MSILLLHRKKDIFVPNVEEAMTTSVKANKKLNDWVVAIFCDYGKPGTKKLIRASYTLESGKNSWEKFHKIFSKNGYRCWQEDKKGKIINDSNKSQGKKSCDTYRARRVEENC